MKDIKKFVQLLKTLDVESQKKLYLMLKGAKFVIKRSKT